MSIVYNIYRLILVLYHRVSHYVNLNHDLPKCSLYTTTTTTTATTTTRTLTTTTTSAGSNGSRYFSCFMFCILIAIVL